MKHILITTIAAVLVVGCGESQQSATAPEAKPVKPAVEQDSNAQDSNAQDSNAQDSNAQDSDAQDSDEAEQAAPSMAKAPDISIWDAVKTRNIEAVKQHLDAGTDVNWMDEDEYTPLDFAIFNKDNEIAELLHEYGGKHGTIHSAAYAGNNEAVKEFLSAGVDVNVKGGGRTPLDLAIQFRNTETAELLRKHGGKTAEQLKVEGK